VIISHQKNIFASVSLFSALSAILLTPSVFGDSGPKIEYKPLSIGAMEEFGMLQSGRFGASSNSFRDEWLDHFATSLTQSVVIDDKWFVNVGLGGIFQFQKQEVISPLWGGTQYRMFFIGPTVANLEYEALGGDRSLRFGTGSFGVKYNPDASNLGEYLFRSAPYPTYIMTGSYALVNNTGAGLQGMKASYSAGNLSADLYLSTETGMPPLYDLSLAAVLKYRVGDGLLDLGLGANFKRIIPIRPSKTTRKNRNNAYFTGPDANQYSGNLSTYDEEVYFDIRKILESKNLADSAYYQGLYVVDSLRAANVRKWVTDSIFTTVLDSLGNPISIKIPNPSFVNPSSYSYFSQGGIIVDFLASIDLKKIIPSSIFGPNDLKLYFEVALLGVKNYPVFYEKAAERMPIMFGINLPGFRFLDLISVQGEYFNSPHVNSFYESINTNNATPEVVKGSDYLLSGREYKDGLSKDNLSWSVLIKKELVKGLSMTVQAARDHVRMVSYATFAGPFLDPNDVFYSKRDWYWMVQFGFGI